MTNPPAQEAKDDCDRNDQEQHPKDYQDERWYHNRQNRRHQEDAPRRCEQHQQPYDQSTHATPLPSRRVPPASGRTPAAQAHLQ